MKKWKFFMSLLKERDWLEDMARQGWLLKDMTLGMLYHFEEIEPAEKVYEIDRFTVLRKPQKQMLTARKTALDIAKQAGWEVVTHDEDMNYYFVKDKAGDESDEFYDDEELRRERAEKYRRHFGHDVLRELIMTLLIVAIVYTCGMMMLEVAGDSIAGFAWPCVITVLGVVVIMLFTLDYAQKLYEELCMSREEWEHRKQFGEKRKFRKTQELLSFLQNQNEQGLTLIDYKNGTYLFDETTTSYQYEIDTKQALKKRLKTQGKKYRWERKDWNLQSFQWYEMSIAEAQSQGLELVSVIGAEVLVYKCERQDNIQQTLLNPDYNEAMGWMQKFLDKGWVTAVLMGIGFVIGLVSALLF